ncbi:MAG: NAD(P)H-hydrate dehydratase [Dysgonomonas sp.]|nr:NAD(P)H-hydrate dehydratase [Dysgonomonas sp.]
MKILTGSQIKEADIFTIQNEPISSIDLMERASQAISEWICNHVEKDIPLVFIIGKGNNGGDGLAVARILYHNGYNCSVYQAFDKDQLSEESCFNLERLPQGVRYLTDINIDEKSIIVDCLLGTGVKGEIKDRIKNIIEKINSLPNKVVSIDLPSGMKSEFGNLNQAIIEADITLTLEFPKLAMLLPEAGNYCGDINVLRIGISKDYICNSQSCYVYVDEYFINNMKLARDKFGHKGIYGHALLICGSKEMIGAAILSTGAALRSGCGLVTAHVPAEERLAVQINYPSAILSLDKSSHFSHLPNQITKYTSIGIGPGLGQNVETVEALRKLMESTDKPMVIDADALNIIASHDRLIRYIPKNSILTPHIGELKRLIGEWKDEEHKLSSVRKLSTDLQSIIIVKGAHTMICCPDGDYYFNSTGNSGMAKGGSGDVLTGYITGLLARGYSSKSAAIMGVYVHGLAGDRVADKYGNEAMNSQDLIDSLYL